MKKLLLIVFLFTSMGAYSQVVIDENIHADIPDKKEYKEEKKKSAEEGEEEKMLSNKQSSLNFDYQFLDGGYGLGIGLAWKHLLLNYSLKSGETQSPVTENSGWDVGIGAHYRFWYKNLLFLDADLGVRYAHWKFKYTTKEQTGGHTTPSGVYIPEYDYDNQSESNGNFGLFISPKIGVNLYKGVSIAAGYRWDFSKFKFDKDHIGDYFTLGLIFVWD
ncbi:unknown [Bacteroides sp. CAG:875]|nr:unknown [Bacteroides sp. CAG:875]